MFTYTTKYWSKDGDIVCQFFGYNNTPTWPLSENYSKWTLILYKPWIKCTDELKADDGTFKKTLEDFMYDTKLFPSKIRTEILRVKRQEIFDFEEGEDLYVVNQAASPASQRENPQFEEHYNAALSPIEVEIYSRKISLLP